MIETLELENHHKVLEIGSGYQTALLVEIAAQVYSIEIVPELAERFRKILEQLNYQNIHLKCGDGLTDWAEQTLRIYITLFENQTIKESSNYWSR
ncbi:MAG: protein-L-isoaspartate(D-aspartate) O-methyltransferase [Psychromonas sp.]|jgi:protein-L-isoaspartate(D-aspartate) O-methyltransferase|uniref:protein-L-isoaspartate O-methyltransferase family protein n=1 Tax=Psychromonas sp. TaxID=1884585 RepID=UPI0039E4F435